MLKGNFSVESGPVRIKTELKLELTEGEVEIKDEGNIDQHSGSDTSDFSEDDDLFNSPIMIENIVLKKNEQKSSKFDNVSEGSEWEYKLLTVGDMEGFRREVEVINRSEKNLEIHIKKQYTCRGCGDTFLFQKNLLKHLKRMTIHLVYFCEFCDSTLKFHNNCILKNHIYIHEKSINFSKLVQMKTMSNGHDQKECEIMNAHLVPNFVDDIKCAKMWKQGTSPLAGPRLCSTNFCIECETHFHSLQTHLLGNNNKPRDDLKCKICSFPSPSPCAFSFHIRIHTKLCPHVCPECGHMFFEEEMFDFHLRNECCYFNKTISLYCSHCGIIFLNPEQFMRHIKSTHNTVLYRCKACLITFASFKLANEHSISQHNTTVGLNKICLTCHFCHNNLFLKKDYEMHIEQHTKDYKFMIYTFKCFYCTFVTISRAQFKEHKYNCATPTTNFNEPTCSKKIVQDPIKMLYACNLCNLVLNPEWRRISNHFTGFHKILDIEFMHKFIRKFKCTEQIPSCVKQIETKKKTTGKKRYNQQLVCKRCSYLAVSIDQLRNHFVIHRGDSSAYQCLECGDCFVVKQSLKMHLKYAHNIEETDKYITAHNVCSEIISEPLKKNQCKVCRSKYETEEELKNHFRSHGMAFLNEMKPN